MNTAAATTTSPRPRPPCLRTIQSASSASTSSVSASEFRPCWSRRSSRAGTVLLIASSAPTPFGSYLDSGHGGEAFWPAGADQTRRSGAGLRVGPKPLPNPEPTTRSGGIWYLRAVCPLSAARPDSSRTSASAVSAEQLPVSDLKGPRHTTTKCQSSRPATRRWSTRASATQPTINCY